jgi:hypothetical protein
MLRLKICDKGTEMLMEIFFSRDMLIPLMCGLVLEIKFKIVLWIVAGDVGPKSSLGVLGLGGMKSSDSIVVGLTVWDILKPAPAKNLLNS